MQGIFGRMFDFNNNDRLDAEEIAAELLFLDKITQSEKDDENDDPFAAYDYDDEGSGFDDE